MKTRKDLKIIHARARNRTHDAFRTLPVELQAMCWEYLPFREVSRLALVCTHWRDASARCPQLWNHLRLSQVPSDAQPLFARSGNLKIRLSVSVRTYADWIHLRNCLRVFAPRLYDLRVVLSLPPRMEASMEGVTKKVFSNPAPVLTHLSISFQARGFFLPEDTFDGCAPNLSSVDLHGVVIPERCPAMKTVQSVCLGSSVYNLRWLFKAFPSIARLRIDNLKYNEYQRAEPSFVPIPEDSRLKECEFMDDAHDDAGLHKALRHMMHCGYLDVPNVTLRSSTSGTLEFVSTQADRFCVQKLTINGDCSAHLRASMVSESGLDAGITTVDVYAEAVDSRDFQRFLETKRHAASQIQHLVIPLFFPSNVPLVLRGIVLPRLLTLAISCGEPSHVGHSLLNDSSFGIIYAPALTRLEFRRASGYTGAIQPLDPAHVANFSENCLDVNQAFDQLVDSDDSDSDSEYSGSSSSIESEAAEAIVFDPPSIDSSQPVELWLDPANGIRFLGRETLPRYLLERDSSGKLLFLYKQEENTAGLISADAAQEEN